MGKSDFRTSVIIHCKMGTCEDNLCRNIKIQLPDIHLHVIVDPHIIHYTKMQNKKMLHFKCIKGSRISCNINFLSSISTVCFFFIHFLKN